MNTDAHIHTLLPHSQLWRCYFLQLEAELRDLEAQSAELQVEGQNAISEYKVGTHNSRHAVSPAQPNLAGLHAELGA